MSLQARATGSSVIHRLDPRAKILAAAALILSVNLAPAGSWGFYAAILGLIWLAAFLSRVPLHLMLKRSLIALPFVLAAIAVLFTTPGEGLVTVPRIGWTVTSEGVGKFLDILCRFWAAVQAAFLLTMVTPVPDLLSALRSLKVPSILVSIIGFLYRYLFVIGDEATRMKRARAARSAGRGTTRRPGIVWQARVVGLMVGSLFLRALSRSERIHSAMMSRGYTGEPKSLITLSMGACDWLVAGCAGSLVLLVLSWRFA